MKKAHIYKLKVIWNARAPWDIDILAIDANTVNMWLSGMPETDLDYIKKIDIELIKRDAETVKEGFLAKGIN